MSDITIRLDGIILGLAIVLGAGIFVAVAAGTAFWAALANPPGARSWSFAKRSLSMAALHAIALAVLLVWFENAEAPSGPDLVDWLAIPWVAVILVGFIFVFRKRIASSTG